MRLKQLYPGRVKTLRYEDGALDPQQYTSEIYKFLGLTLTDDVKEHVDFLTSSGGKETAFTVRRSDPTSAVQKWRHTMLYERVTVIDRQCGRVYPSLGYRKVDSVRDLKSDDTLVLKKSVRFKKYS